MLHKSRKDMKKVKTSQIPDGSASIAAELVVAYEYAPSHVQALRNRIVDAVNETDDEERLMECLEMLHASTMPSVYTDEEFEKEVRLSEASGNISHEEALTYFAKWGAYDKVEEKGFS